jgi:hypothetical protein
MAKPKSTKTKKSARAKPTKKTAKSTKSTKKPRKPSTSTTIEFDGQRLELLRYDNKDQLEVIAPEIYDRVKDSVFWEYDEEMAPIMANRSGTVVRGDITIKHPKGIKTSSFERILEPLGDHGRLGMIDSRVLIFDGNLKMGNSLAISERRVIILGDLDTVGLSNLCGELHVEGKTRISGAMTFDSNDGGFTKLDLSEPVGFIVTHANAFDINLKARYYFDPIFSCGFKKAPKTPHEQRIRSAFDNKPTVITLEQLAAFFRWRVDDEAGDEIANGDYASWVRDVIALTDSRVFATYFDDPSKATR